MRYEKLFTYIGLTAIVLLLFGLGGWYLFIREKITSVEDASTARGFSIGIPSFMGSRGSTAANNSSGSGVGSTVRSFLGFESGEIAEKNPETSAGVGSESNDFGSTPAKRVPRAWHVNETPVAGIAFIASSTKLQYVERATGHLFEADAVTGEVRRITNTLIPKVYDTALGSNVLIERSFEGKTLLGRVSTTTQDGVQELLTRDLGVTVTDIAAHKASQDVLLLVETPNAVRLLQTSWQSSSTRQVLSVPAGNFSIVWPSISRVFLLEKPASGIESTLFRASSALAPVIKNIPGLSALPHPVSDTYLYSADTGTQIYLFVRPSGASAVELQVQTIADKCVWGREVAYCAVPKSIPGTNFMNRWYRGEVHTDDEWYTISPGAAREAKFFTHSSDAGIDVEEVHINDSEEYLAFTNARDKSLWILRIKE